MSFKTYAETGKFENDYRLNEALHPKIFIQGEEDSDKIDIAIKKSKISKEIQSLVKNAGFKPLDGVWIDLMYGHTELNFCFNIPLKVTFNDDIDNLKPNFEFKYDKIKYNSIKQFEKYVNELNSILELAKKLNNINFSKSDIVIIDSN